MFRFRIQINYLDIKHTASVAEITTEQSQYFFKLKNARMLLHDSENSWVKNK